MQSLLLKYVMGLLAELRRRRLFRVAALYVVGTWMVLQVFDLLFPGLGIPDAVMNLAFIGALLGFPVALMFGWIYDITPHPVGVSLAREMMRGWICRNSGSASHRRRLPRGSRLPRGYPAARARS